MRLIVLLALMLASWWAGAYGHSRGGYRGAFLLGAIVLGLLAIVILVLKLHTGGMGQRFG